MFSPYPTLPLQKTKCLVPTQLSILFNDSQKSLTRLFPHFNIVFIYYWTCSRPDKSCSLGRLTIINQSCVLQTCAANRSKIRLLWTTKVPTFVKAVLFYISNVKTLIEIETEIVGRITEYDDSTLPQDVCDWKGNLFYIKNVELYA